MPNPLIVKCSSWMLGNLVLLARIRSESGAYVTQASLLSGTVKVLDGYTPVQIGSTINLTIASVIFDTLQQDAIRWVLDTTGYNFLFTVPASYFPKAGLYLVQTEFLDTSNNPVFCQWEDTALGTF